MKPRISCLALVAALALPAVAGASPALRSFGFGAGLSLGTSLSGQIAVPVNVMPILRVEPLIGISRSGKTTEDDSGTDMVTTSSVDQNIQLGLGVYYLLRTNDPFLLYVGPRFGVLLQSDTSTSDATGKEIESVTSQTNIGLGLGFGGEYFFNPRLSLGAEININYVIVGEPTTEVDGKEPDDDKITVSESGLTTGTNVFVRFYY